MEPNWQKSQPGIQVDISPSDVRFTKGDAIASILIGFIIGVFAPSILNNVGKSLPLQEFYLVIFPILTLVGMWVTYIIAARVPVLVQIAKFGAVGVANTVIDFGILNFLSAYFEIYSGAAISPLNATSFTVAVVNSYFWNKYWTFKAGKESGSKQFIEFIIVSVIGILINTAIVYLATTFAQPFAGFSEAQWLNVSKVFATFLSLVWNFIGYKFIVFKK